MADENDEWADVICEEETEVMSADELIDYYNREALKLVTTATQTGELLAEERQINAGLRTQIAERAKTIGELRDSLQLQRDISAVAIVGCVCLFLAVLFLIFTSF